jgi:hypothetical protein
MVHAVDNLLLLHVVEALGYQLISRHLRLVHYGIRFDSAEVVLDNREDMLNRMCSGL